MKTKKRKYCHNRNQTSITGSMAHSVDWTNAGEVRSVTEKLLLERYEVMVQLHPDRLCPPVNNRENYLIWLNSIFSVCNLADNKIKVLDIGTGASLIYPVIGCAKFGWEFIGSDIDELSLEWAQKHVLTTDNPTLMTKIRTVVVPNSIALQSLIESYMVLPSSSDRRSCTFRLPINDILQTTLPNDAVSISKFRGPIRCALVAAGFEHAVVCQEKAFYRDSNEPAATTLSARQEMLVTAMMSNPPFYDLTEEIQSNERTVCQGQLGEMRTTGGEIAFVAAMIADSLVLRESVLWYTSMLGFKSSVKPLLRLLAAAGIVNVRSTRFTQGRTMRWGIAWSLSDCGFLRIGSSDKLFASKNDKSHASDSSKAVLTLRLSCSDIINSSTAEEITALTSSSCESGDDPIPSSDGVGAGLGAGLSVGAGLDPSLCDSPWCACMRMLVTRLQTVCQQRLHQETKFSITSKHQEWLPRSIQTNQKPSHSSKRSASATNDDTPTAARSTDPSATSGIEWDDDQGLGEWSDSISDTSTDDDLFPSNISLKGPTAATCKVVGRLEVESSGSGVFLPFEVAVSTSPCNGTNCSDHHCPCAREFELSLMQSGDLQQTQIADGCSRVMSEFDAREAHSELRAIFNSFKERLSSEMLRNNRRWRRLLASH